MTSPQVTPYEYRLRRAPFVVLTAWLLAMLCPEPMLAQVSAEEHAKHHPGQAAGQTTTAPTGPMGGMSEMMGEMMKGMGAPAPKQLYPSLMDLPALTPQQRATVEAQANDRLHAGVASVSTALGRLSEASANNDYPAMQEATAQMREGMAMFETGLATRRALAEGKAPRDIALQWFKQEMNLLPPQSHGASRGILGISWFHLFVMVLLSGFAIVMVWMYFHKMRRASLLLHELTGGASSPSPGGITTATSTSPVTSMTAAAVPDDAQPVSKRWSGKLHVGCIFEESPDTKTFRLMNPLGGVLPFSYLPGQFLTVTAPIDGKLVKRSYTIASSPTQHDFAEITVKHEDQGLVSGYLHNRVKKGDLIECSGPSGSFIFTGRECKCILLIAGGVGITPLMSVIRYLTDRSWAGEIFLIYSIHSPQDFVFREELEHLQRRHSNLHVVVTVTHPEGTDWQGHKGRISKELITQSVPDVVSRYVHICGPVPMTEAAKTMLAELGVPPQRIKTEAFGPALGKPEPMVKRSVLPTGAAMDDKATTATLPTVTFASSDKSASLSPDKTILDVADEIGVEIDNSCRVGTCGTCRVKLLSGQVTMAVEDGLEPGDKEKNIILACQAKATEDVKVEA